MSLQSSVKLTGHLSIKKYNDKDELIYETEVPNLVVTTGKEFLASRIISNTSAVMTNMGVGDDSSAPVLSQTALINELARVPFNTATSSGASVTFTGIFLPGTATGNLTEAGIFNTASSSVITFDGDANVNAADNKITYIAHGFVTGDKVTYTDGGGVTIVGLIDGGTYYIIKVDNDTVKLATSSANATAGTAINIDDGSGLNHKLIKGTMMCRTTFPVIAKSASETVAISWVVTVG